MYQCSSRSDQNKMSFSTALKPPLWIRKIPIDMEEYIVPFVIITAEQIRYIGKRSLCIALGMAVQMSDSVESSKLLNSLSHATH